MAGSLPRQRLKEEKHRDLGSDIPIQGKLHDAVSLSVLPNQPQDQIDKEGHEGIGEEDQ
jgi:hypothetical protein